MRVLDLTDDEITEEVYDEEGNKKTLKYKIRAIINHHGETISMGHYTAYCKRHDHNLGKEMWYHFNDEDVYPGTE